MGNQRNESYLIVLSEPKIDLDLSSAEAHSEITRQDFLEALKDGRVSRGPIRLEINGADAVQYELRGSVDGIKVIYLHTTIEGKNSFHQILAWTLPSKWRENQAVLESVINSFQEN